MNARASRSIPRPGEEITSATRCETTEGLARRATVGEEPLRGAGARQETRASMRIRLIQRERREEQNRPGLASMGTGRGASAVPAGTGGWLLDNAVRR